MSNHNTSFSKGAIKGVKLRAHATGKLIAKSLNLEASLKKATATTKATSTGNDEDTPKP